MLGTKTRPRARTATIVALLLGGGAVALAACWALLGARGVGRAAQDDSTARAASPSPEPVEGNQSRAEGLRAEVSSNGSAGVAGPGSGPDGGTLEADEAGDDGSDDTELAALLARVERVVGGFFSEDPDFFELNHVLAELSGHVQVDGESVGVDELDGIVRGRFSVEGSPLRGRFEIGDQEMSVTLTTPRSGTLDLPVVTQEVTFAFDTRHGTPSDVFQSVQAHPNVRDRTLGERVGEESEVIVGWTAALEADGIHAQPITISTGTRPGEWHIGKAGSLPNLDLPGATDGGAMVPWMRLLAPYRR